MGDDCEIHFSQHDNSDENGLSNDYGNDSADDREDPILISSGDEMAMERSEVKVKIQTVVLSVRRMSQYSNCQLICHVYRWRETTMNTIVNPNKQKSSYMLCEQCREDRDLFYI